MLSCFTDTDGGRGEAVGEGMEGGGEEGGARGSGPVKMTRERLRTGRVLGVLGVEGCGDAASTGWMRQRASSGAEGEQVQSGSLRDEHLDGRVEPDAALLRGGQRLPKTPPHLPPPDQRQKGIQLCFN